MAVRRWSSFCEGRRYRSSVKSSDGGGSVLSIDNV